MSALSDADSASFLNRFGGFHDAVIRRVIIEFTRDRARRTATIEILARDGHHGGQWVLCQLLLRRLSELAVSEGRSTYLVLYGGIQLAWIADTVFVDFGSYTEHAATPESFRESHFYFAGASLEWDIGAYEE